jgi:hypothetical protein
MFNWFKLNSKKDPKEGSWNPNTMTLEMQQPTSPVAPSTERVVIEQAVRVPIIISNLFDGTAG